MIRWGLGRNYITKFRGWAWGILIHKWVISIQIGPYEFYAYVPIDRGDEIRKRPLR